MQRPVEAVKGADFDGISRPSDTFRQKETAVGKRADEVGDGSRRISGTKHASLLVTFNVTLRNSSSFNDNLMFSPITLGSITHFKDGEFLSATLNAAISGGSGGD